MDYTVHGILQARILEPFTLDHPNPGIEPRSPILQADPLPAEPQRKSKNTGVGSLSLLQQSFPTQESNQGLLHCRQILYQLSSQRSPNFPQEEGILPVTDFRFQLQFIPACMACPADFRLVSLHNHLSPILKSISPSAFPYVCVCTYIYIYICRHICIGTDMYVCPHPVLALSLENPD